MPESFWRDQCWPVVFSSFIQWACIFWGYGTICIFSLKNLSSQIVTNTLVFRKTQYYHAYTSFLVAWHFHSVHIAYTLCIQFLSQIYFALSIPWSHRLSKWVISCRVSKSLFFRMCSMRFVTLSLCAPFWQQTNRLLLKSSAAAEFFLCLLLQADPSSRLETYYFNLQNYPRLCLRVFPKNSVSFCTSGSFVECYFMSCRLPCSWMFMTCSHVAYMRILASSISFSFRIVSSTFYFVHMCRLYTSICISSRTQAAPDIRIGGGQRRRAPKIRSKLAN